MNSNKVFSEALKRSLVRDEQVRLTVAKSRSPFSGYYVAVDLEYRHMGHQLSLFGTDRVNGFLIVLPHSAASVYDAFIDETRQSGSISNDAELAMRLIRHPHAICVNRDDIVLNRPVMSEVEELLLVPVTMENEESVSLSRTTKGFVEQMKSRFDFNTELDVAYKLHPSWREYLDRNQQNLSMAM